MVEMGDIILNKSLNDDDLENINGGMSANSGGKNSKAAPTQIRYCIKCKKDTQHNVYSGSRMVCSICGTTPSL